jgi:glutathione peroxidase
MTTFAEELPALSGGTLAPDLFAGKAVLVVNVASRCGLTPQYEALEQLQRTYGDRGFTVLGVPTGQFAGQELDSDEEIAEFCSTTYGTTFPMTTKLDVNGQGRHPLYERLTQTPDEEGRAGEIDWNFEKFLVGRDGTVVARFRPGVVPDAEQVTAAIESQLA